MKKIFKLLFFFPLFIYYGCDTVEPINNFNQIDFIKVGGIMGLQQKTSVYEEGTAAFSQFYNGKQFVISAKLNPEELAGLFSALNEEQILRFADSYKLPQPIRDGFNYYIHYKSSRGSKDIYVEDGAEIPPGLGNIIREMAAIGDIIQSSPDYGTLISVWNNESTIKVWPFSQVQLHVKVFYYDSLGNSDNIKQYFDEVKRDFGYDILYWNRDSLYEIYDSREQGYFNVHTGYPAKLWSEQFSVDIEQFKVEGLEKTVDEWNRLGFIFKKNYVFVTDSLADNGKAIKVTLMPGKIAGNTETGGLVSENKIKKMARENGI